MSRRAALADGAGLLVAPSVLAQSPDKCPLGPPQDHVKRPPVFLDYDQVELDAAYDQDPYQPHTARVNQRPAFRSYDARVRLGDPIRTAYGADPVEELDIWPARRKEAPVFAITAGTLETPEFQRQPRDFAKALREAGVPLEFDLGRELLPSGWRRWGPTPSTAAPRCA